MRKTREAKDKIKYLNLLCVLLTAIVFLTESAVRGEKARKPNQQSYLPIPKLRGLNQPPEGFVALFNGKDLTGWKGLLTGPYDNPIKRAKLSPEV